VPRIQKIGDVSTSPVISATISGFPYAILILIVRYIIGICNHRFIEVYKGTENIYIEDNE
jgi:hypothetical protein